MKPPTLEYRLRETDLLYFLHIPKTAGTTLYHLLDERFKPEHICPARFWPEFFDLPPDSLKTYRFFRGHFGYPIHWFLDRKPVYITILRDPVERAISCFEQVRRHPYDFLHETVMSQNMSFEDFIRSPATRYTVSNMQARSLVFDRDVRSPEVRSLNRLTPNACGLDGITEMTLVDAPDDEILEIARQRLDEFAWVGLVERFQESLLLLSYILGWPPILEVSRLNQAPVRLRQHDLSPDVVEEVRALNPLDMQLYHYASQQFEASLSQMLATLSARYGEDARPGGDRFPAPPQLRSFNHPDALFNQLVHHHNQRFMQETTPVSSVNLVMSDPINGIEWHEREGVTDGKTPFRWTGPESKSTLNFCLMEAESYRVCLWIVNSIQVDGVEQFRLFINGHAVQTRPILTQETLTVYQGRFDRTVFQGTPFVELLIEVPTTVPVESVYPNTLDSRRVNLALHRLQIFPDVPQAEDYTAMSCLLPFPLNDPDWMDAKTFLEKRMLPGDQIAGASEFIRVFPQQFATDAIAHLDPGSMPWIVLHKNQIERASYPFLLRLVLFTKPVFANSVFIIFSNRSDLQRLSLLATHVRVLTKAILRKLILRPFDVRQIQPKLLSRRTIC